MALVCLQPQLPSEPAPRLQAPPAQRQCEKTCRHLLTRGHDHIILIIKLFARKGIARSAFGIAHQLVGLARHCGHNHRHALTFFRTCGDDVRHIRNAIKVSYGCAAKFQNRARHFAPYPVVFLGYPTIFALIGGVHARIKQVS